MNTVGRMVSCIAYRLDDRVNRSTGVESNGAAAGDTAIRTATALHLGYRGQARRTPLYIDLVAASESRLYAVAERWPTRSLPIHAQHH